MQQQPTVQQVIRKAMREGWHSYWAPLRWLWRGIRWLWRRIL